MNQNQGKVDNQTTPHLGQKIKARHLFSLSFGCIIGVGWIIILGDWLELAGPLGAILAFAAGALLVMVVGVCYAELATMIPVAGGEVAYAYEIYGVKTSFALGWFLALAKISVTAFEAISAGWIIGTLIPWSKGVILYSNRGEPVHLGSLCLGLGGMALLTYMNYRGLKSAASFQEVLTYALIILSLIFISAGILFGKMSNVEPLFSKTGLGPAVGGILAVFVMVPFMYTGFNVIPQIMEEKAPRTSLKMAGKLIVISIFAAAVFYLLVILSASMATPWQKLLGFELPAASAFEAAFRSPLLAKVVLLAGLCGIITTWNTVFIFASRVIFALGRARIIPSVFGKIHPSFESPFVSIIFVSVLGSLGVFLGKNAIIPIVNMAGSCYALAFLLSCLGVIKLRLTRPEQHRPYRVPGGKLTAAVGVIASSFMLFLALYRPYIRAKGAFPIEWALIIGWSLLGLLFWGLARKIRLQVSESERRKLILGRSAPLK